MPTRRHHIRTFSALSSWRLWENRCPTFRLTRLVLILLLNPLACCSAMLAAAASDETPVAGVLISQAQAAFVRTKVLPLLESRCFECHGTQEKIKGGLRLTSVESMLKGGDSGPAIVRSKPEESRLIQAVRYESFEMPPRSRLPDEEIAILSQWIADGALWPKDLILSTEATATTPFPLKQRIASHWAWKQIARPDVPAVTRVDWPASDIDRFLLAKMEEARITPAPDADRRSILRRLYFDLIGLPPTIGQQDRFFSDPAETSAAMERVVDELLAAPQFGERWARHWLDLVRYAETLGHEFDYPLPYAFRYRDYVIRALNADVPYDQFVREHIAGDLIEQPRRNPEKQFNESIIATGFWFLGEDKHAPVDVQLDESLKIDNQIDVFSKTFLGLTISCARCHDHKFDAITTEDYYGLTGFLQSSRRRVEWLDEHDKTHTLLLDLMRARDIAAEKFRKCIPPYSPEVTAELFMAALNDDPAPQVPADARPKIGLIRKALLEPDARQLSNPLSLLASIIQKPAELSDATVIEQWERDVRAGLQTDIGSATIVEKERSRSSITIADLRGGIPEGWLPYGATFGHLTRVRSLDHGMEGVFSVDPSEGRFMRWSTTGGIPEFGDLVSSAVLSPRLKGTLHSPEFELTHPEIHVLASGKNARVRLIIDGFVMHEFSELLFAGTRQPIDTDGQFRWIRIAGDTKRYLGHRCHLEFLDEGDGWFAVKEVRLAQEDEVFASRPEISHINQSAGHNMTPQLSRQELVQRWVGIIVLDPAWPAIALKLGLVSAESQQALEQATTAWLEQAEESPTGDPILVMCDGTGEDTHIHIRGGHKNLGPMASRRLLTAIDGARPLGDPVVSGRLDLAGRVLADDNPFPARVMVNRVWQHLFGRGIVATSDNFGVMGEAPTHPELLDLLAADFRNDHWSLKRLIRKLVLTRTYRLSSQRNPLAENIDPNNRLLHRFSIRRLEGEVIRDAMLAISGQRDSTMYGPSVPVYLTSFMQGRGRPGTSGPLDGAGRRSIYQSVNRNFLNPFMLTFDTPQPASTVGRRSQSNVPAQALILLNNEFVHQQAEKWAMRLTGETGAVQGTVLQSACLQAFARGPAKDELEAMTDFAAALANEKGGNPDEAMRDVGILTEVCHMLLNQKEFLFLD